VVYSLYRTCNAHVKGLTAAFQARGRRRSHAFDAGSLALRRLIPAYAFHRRFTKRPKVRKRIGPRYGVEEKSTRARKRKACLSFHPK
jgi:hypothetical protein